MAKITKTDLRKLADQMAQLEAQQEKLLDKQKRLEDARKRAKESAKLSFAKIGSLLQDALKQKTVSGVNMNANPIDARNGYRAYHRYSPPTALATFDTIHLTTKLVK